MLIVGANPVARAIGDVLRRQGFRVKLADTSYEEVRAARMAGLETYYGDPISSHADQYLELVGIGRLFAMSRRSRWNTLACMKYRGEFGPNRVFSLRNAEDRDASERERLPEDYQVPRMFSEDLSYEKFASLLAQGAEVKVINLTESFDLDNWKETTGNRLIPLFSLAEGQKLRVFTQDEEPPLDPGSKLIALVWAARD